MLLELRPFFFLRHGATARNEAGLVQGNVEVPLNDRGRRQAASAAGSLVGRGIATIVSSPLGRARETAEAVAAELGLHVHVHDDLREAELGALDGQPKSHLFDDWVEGNFLPAGAESMADLRRRAIGAVNACTALPGPVLIVGHGGFFRSLLPCFGVPVSRRLPNGASAHVVPPGDAGGQWTVEYME